MLFKIHIIFFPLEHFFLNGFQSRFSWQTNLKAFDIWRITMRQFWSTFWNFVLQINLKVILNKNENKWDYESLTDPTRYQIKSKAKRKEWSNNNLCQEDKSIICPKQMKCFSGFSKSGVFTSQRFFQVKGRSAEVDKTGLVTSLPLTSTRVAKKIEDNIRRAVILKMWYFGTKKLAKLRRCVG